MPVSKRLGNISQYILHRIWSFISSGELLLYICFVALATLMWYGHAMSSVRNANVPVRIVYVGVPHNMAFTPALPKEINVEVRDAGNRLQTYFTSPLEMTINLSDQIHGTDGSVYISEESIRRSINNMLQGTSKLQNVNPAQIHATYSKQEEKEVCIVSRVRFEPASEYQLLGDTKIEPQKVRIYGYTNQLEKVDTIYTDSVVYTEVRDSFTTSVALIAPQGIRLRQDSVNICVLSERFTEKTFTLPITPRNVPDGQRLRLFPQEVTITIRCAMSHFADINENDIHIECDFPTGNEEQLTLFSSCDNPFVTNIHTTPSKVEFIIEK